jgi:hypothetical protein
VRRREPLGPLPRRLRGLSVLFAGDGAGLEGLEPNQPKGREPVSEWGGFDDDTGAAVSLAVESAATTHAPASTGPVTSPAAPMAASSSAGIPSINVDSLPKAQPR